MATRFSGSPFMRLVVKARFASSRAYAALSDRVSRSTLSGGTSHSMCLFVTIAAPPANSAGAACFTSLPVDLDGCLDVAQAHQLAQEHSRVFDVTVGRIVE
jgi:hypothetical protein